LILDGLARPEARFEQSALAITSSLLD